MSSPRHPLLGLLLRPAPSWTARLALYSLPPLLWRLWAEMGQHYAALDVLFLLLGYLERIAKGGSG